MRAGRYTQDVRFILRSVTQMPHKLCEHQPGGCGNTRSSKQALITKSPLRLTGALKAHLGYKVVEGNNNWVQRR